MGETVETSKDERCRTDSSRMRHRYRVEMQHRLELNLPSSHLRLSRITGILAGTLSDLGVITSFSQIRYGTRLKTLLQE